MVHHKKDTDKKKEAKKVSFQQPNHLLIPNGQLLRGIPVQTGGEYKLPTLTDHPATFATKRRIKE